MWLSRVGESRTVFCRLEPPMAAPPSHERLLSDVTELLAIPSPVGMTGRKSRRLAARAAECGLPVHTSNRGTVAAKLTGRTAGPGRAVLAHVDTNGLVVTGVEDDGTVAVRNVGEFSVRLAEGASCTLLDDHGAPRAVGTLLPPLASEHRFGEEQDRQPVTWDHMRLRLDDHRHPAEIGIHRGDLGQLDPQPRVTNGWISSRLLDNNGGLAISLELLARAADGWSPQVDTWVVWTRSEEVDTGASGQLPADVAEALAVDIAIVAPGQAASEHDAVLVMADSLGPYDRAVTLAVAEAAASRDLPLIRDVFPHYHSDVDAMWLAGADIAGAAVGFGVSSGHALERTHVEALARTAEVVGAWLDTRLSDPLSI